VIRFASEPSGGPSAPRGYSLAFRLRRDRAAWLPCFRCSQVAVQRESSRTSLGHNASSATARRTWSSDDGGVSTENSLVKNRNRCGLNGGTSDTRLKIAGLEVRMEQAAQDRRAVLSA